MERIGECIENGLDDFDALINRASPALEPELSRQSAVAPDRTTPSEVGSGVRQQSLETGQVQDECLELAPAFMQLAGAPPADLAQEVAVFEVAAGPLCEFVKRTIDGLESPELSDDQQDCLGHARPRSGVDLDMGGVRIDLERQQQRRPGRPFTRASQFELCPRGSVLGTILAHVTLTTAACSTTLVGAADFDA